MRSAGTYYKFHGKIKKKIPNWLKNLQFVSYSEIHPVYKYRTILTLRICNQGPSKRKTWPPLPPPLTPVWNRGEGVRVVVISFRNIAKNQHGVRQKRRSCPPSSLNTAPLAAYVEKITSEVSILVIGGKKIKKLTQKNYFSPSKKPQPNNFFTCVFPRVPTLLSTFS